jgi:aspartate ammonia-lyase
VTFAIGKGMDWTCWVIIVGCVQTIAVRLLKIMRDLRVRGEGGAS